MKPPPADRERMAEIVRQLVAIEDAEHRATFANQGQGMDGYTMLAHFRDIAKRARAALAPADADKSAKMSERETITISVDDHNALLADRRVVQALQRCVHRDPVRRQWCIEDIAIEAMQTSREDLLAVLRSAKAV